MNNTASVIRALVTLAMLSPACLVAACGSSETTRTTTVERTTTVPVPMSAPAPVSATTTTTTREVQ